MFSQGPRTPASGCYYLNALTPESQEMYLRFDQTARRSPYRMSRILARHQLVTKIQQAEIEAKEACDWLRAAGFPQYAQLYEVFSQPFFSLLLHSTFATPGAYADAYLRLRLASAPSFFFTFCCALSASHFFTTHPNSAFSFKDSGIRSFSAPPSLFFSFSVTVLSFLESTINELLIHFLDNHNTHYLETFLELCLHENV
uniref:Uncharacterized protein n=1 Tax=Sus scrofa TaxID=9823 RepID=A0A5G2QAM2_PIG